MFLVSNQKEALDSKSYARSDAEMLRPVSIRTSIRVGVIGPWQKRKAFRASDQKYEADISIASFLFMSDNDRSMH